MSIPEISGLTVSRASNVASTRCLVSRVLSTFTDGNFCRPPSTFFFFFLLTHCYRTAVHGPGPRCTLWIGDWPHQSARCDEAVVGVNARARCVFVCIMAEQSRANQSMARRSSEASRYTRFSFVIGAFVGCRIQDTFFVYAGSCYDEVWIVYQPHIYWRTWLV